MACVTAEEVKAIMSGCTLTNDQVDPFILSAHALIDRVFASDTTTTAAQKTELEKWLTAHMIFLVYGQSCVTGGNTVIREKVGDAEIEYAVAKIGTGFDGSPYGQILKQLDTTGLLANSGKKSASIYAVKSFEDTEE